MEEAGEEVERLMRTDPPLHWESWHRMKRWYCYAVDRAIQPAQVSLERIVAEQVYLYLHVLPPGDNITKPIEELPVEESVPSEDEIEWAVNPLQNHRSGGPSGMRDEHLKEWLV